MKHSEVQMSSTYIIVNFSTDHIGKEKEAGKVNKTFHAYLFIYMNHIIWTYSQHENVLLRYFSDFPTFYNFFFLLSVCRTFQTRLHTWILKAKKEATTLDSKNTIVYLHFWLPWLGHNRQVGCYLCFPNPPQINALIPLWKNFRALGEIWKEDKQKEIKFLFYVFCWTKCYMFYAYYLIKPLH